MDSPYSIDLAENFNSELNEKVLKAVHDAINTLYCDCEKHSHWAGVQAVYDEQIAKLKKTICKFVDEQSETYTTLLSQA